MNVLKIRYVPKYLAEQHAIIPGRYQKCSFPHCLFVIFFILTSDTFFKQNMEILLHFDVCAKYDRVRYICVQKSNG